MKQLKAAIAEALTEYKWKEVIVRGVRWVETLSFQVTMKLPTEAEIFRVYKEADEYIARARTEYIRSTIDVCCAAPICRGEDMNTRRMVVTNFDWYWHEHPWCVIAVQAMYRFPDMHYFLILRSSNLYRALPYDLHAVAYGFAPEVKKLYDEMFNVKAPANEILHIYATNAHVLKEDWDKLTQTFNVKDLSYEPLPTEKKEKKLKLRLRAIGDKSENTGRAVD